MDWGTLEAAVLADDSVQLPVEELALMICRAMTPAQFHWLAWTFARQGEKGLWMQTVIRVLRVLVRADRLAEFFNLHIVEQDWKLTSDLVRSHYPSIRELLLVQLAYRSRGNRSACFAMMNSGVGEHVDLIPRACDEGRLTPQH